METVFYLGAPNLAWRGRTPRPLFFSYSVLRSRLRNERGEYRRRVTFPEALGPSALDSAGFVVLKKYGRWPEHLTPVQYAADADIFRRYIGQLDFAIPQDHMCENFMLELTGRHEPGGRWADRRTAIRAHQQRTLDSYRQLRDLAPDVPWAGALQGYTDEEYWEHVLLYEAAGIDLRKLPRVAVGSMCKRQHTEDAARILRGLAQYGCAVHALGYKTAGLPAIFGDCTRDPRAATSADSMAWSDVARKRWYIHPGCEHGKREFRKRLGREEFGNCASCLEWALWSAADIEAHARGLRRAPAPGTAHARNAKCLNGGPPR